MKVPRVPEQDRTVVGDGAGAHVDVFGAAREHGELAGDGPRCVQRHDGSVEHGVYDMVRAGRGDPSEHVPMLPPRESPRVGPLRFHDTRGANRPERCT